MGQYHKFMNFDKKEQCDPSGLSKLMEWSYQGNDYLCEIESLLKNEWKGDRVLVVGDYVDDKYEDPRFKKIFDQIKSENTEYNINNIYDYPYKYVEGRGSEIPTRYIYNHDKKQFIDIKKQPIQWCSYDKNANEIVGQKIHPLSLVLSCSNGLGGGDYYSNHAETVGLWVNDCNKIEISDVKLNNDYNELKILYDEYNTKDSNKNILINALYENFNKDNLDKLEKVKFSKNLLLSDVEQKKLKEEVKELIITLSKDEVENDDIEIDK